MMRAVKNGFSLAEVLIVLAIFGILASSFVGVGYYRLTSRNNGLAVITRMREDLTIKRRAALLGNQNATARTFDPASVALPENVSRVTPSVNLPFPGPVWNDQLVAFDEVTGRTTSKQSGWVVIRGADGNQYAVYIPYVSGYTPIYRLSSGTETWELVGVNQ